MYVTCNPGWPSGRTVIMLYVCVTNIQKYDSFVHLDFDWSRNLHTHLIYVLYLNGVRDMTETFYTDQYF